MNQGNRGLALVGYLIVAGVVALGAMWLKPKVFHGETKRAQTSTDTTAALVEDYRKNSAKVAASVSKIGEANAETVNSPQKEFIGREANLVLTKLEPPDPTELLLAEKRKTAVLEGKIAEINRVYGNALEETAEARKETLKIYSAKVRSDQNLQIMAAEHYGVEKTNTQLMIVAGVLLLLYIYTKLTHVGMGGIQEAVADIKAGKNGVDAIDSVTTRLQQQISRIITKLKS